MAQSVAIRQHSKATEILSSCYLSSLLKKNFRYWFCNRYNYSHENMARHISLGSCANAIQSRSRAALYRGTRLFEYACGFGSAGSESKNTQRLRGVFRLVKHIGGFLSDRLVLILTQHSFQQLSALLTGDLPAGPGGMQPDNGKLTVK